MWSAHLQLMLLTCSTLQIWIILGLSVSCRLCSSSLWISWTNPLSASLNLLTRACVVGLSDILNRSTFNFWTTSSSMRASRTTLVSPCLFKRQVYIILYNLISKLLHYRCLVLLRDMLYYLKPRLFSLNGVFIIFLKIF